MTDTCPICGRRTEEYQHRRVVGWCYGNVTSSDTVDCLRLGYDREKDRADQAEADLVTLRGLIDEHIAWCYDQPSVDMEGQDNVRSAWDGAADHLAELTGIGEE